MGAIVVKLLMVLTMMLPKSWGGLGSYHPVSVVSHLHKHLAVLYFLDRKHRLDVIKSHSQGGDDNRGHSEKVTLDANSAYAVGWGVIGEDNTISSMEYLILVDNADHGPPQSTVNVYSTCADQDGWVIQYSTASHWFKKDTIDEVCKIYGLKSEEVKHVLIHGKKPETPS